MLQYYFWLGLRALRRHRWLTGLTVLILSVGVAVSIAALTILHLMSADPLPFKSDRVMTTVLDNAPAEGYRPGDTYVDHQMSYIDLMALLERAPAMRKAGMYAVQSPVEMPRKELGVLSGMGVAGTLDWFGMLEIPFLAGQPWSLQDDQRGAAVVVISKNFAAKLFGKESALGKSITMWGRPYQVVGVMDEWHVRPRFYLINGRSGAFANDEDFVIPFRNAMQNEIPHAGGMSCSNRNDASWKSLLESECTWLMFWAELKNASDRPQLEAFLRAYQQEQEAHDRFPRKAVVRVFNIREWLTERKIVGAENKMAAWLASGFLLLCLVNAVGLLLARFSRRAAEVGVRRALGASQIQIFFQFLTESAVMGIAGAIGGVLLSLLLLYLIGSQSAYLKAVTRMDWIMLGVTVLMSLSAAICAGVFPAWRACRVTPAIQLKSQ
ncbi:ABC transporter permease [Undibacterium squillarum]|uniref:ABC transporter permease n=1 Tax=Undibacterium squillarum TaxID=1131567 RepID=UPI0035AFE2D5